MFDKIWYFWRVYAILPTFCVFFGIFGRYIFSMVSQPGTILIETVTSVPLKKIVSYWLIVPFTLFLWDINEQKNCQSFYCGFSYLDSLSNALTTRFLNSKDRFRICLLNSTANSAQVWWKWAGLAVLSTMNNAIMKNFCYDFFQVRKLLLTNPHFDGMEPH